MKILASILLLILTYQSSISQNNSNINIPITCKLIKGIQIEKLNGDLNFGEIVLQTNEFIETKTPSDGVVFKLKTEPYRNIFVNYSSIELLNNYTNSSSSIFFVPTLVHTGKSSSYTNPIEIPNNSSLTVENENGTGILYLWLGGTLNVNPNSTEGNYSGILTINITY